MHSYKSIIKQIWKIGLPITIQSIVLSLVQLVDNLFIGHLQNATDVSAGVNAVSNLSFILRTLIGGFVSGIGVYFAQASSNNNADQKSKFFRVKMQWGIGLCLILLPIFTIFLRDVSKLWIANGPKQEMASDFAMDYGLYVIPTLMFDILVLVFASSFVEQRKTKLTMIVAIIAIIVNSSLNYPFMYILNMGIKGSAIATGIARFIEVIIWIAYIIKTKPSFIDKFTRFFRISFKELFEVFPKASLWTINGFLASLAFTIQILFLSRFSNDASASLLVAGVIAQIIFALVGGYSQGIWIIITYEITKDDPQNLREIVRKSVTLSTLFGIIMGLMLATTTPLIPIIYPSYNDVTISNAKIMVYSLAMIIPFRIVVGIYLGVLKSAGYAKSLVILDAAYQWLVLVSATVVFTQTENSISFGWIYFIVRVLEIPKTFLCLFIFEKKWKTLKPLVQNEVVTSS